MQQLDYFSRHISVHSRLHSNVEGHCLEIGAHSSFLGVLGLFIFILVDLSVDVFTARVAAAAALVSLACTIVIPQTMDMLFEVSMASILMSLF